MGRDGRADVLTGGEGDWPRPRLLASRCLEFDHCRWNGAVVESEIVRLLAGRADFVTVCPEVGIGLGVPRDPIRLVGSGSESVRLIQPSTGMDLTEKMRDFSRQFIAGLGPVDGAILKFRSPSCGISDVRVHSPEGSRGPAGRRPGLFGEAVLEALEGVPVVHEGRLLNLALREHFLTGIFTLARFRSAREEALSSRRAGPLVEFHSSAKLLLMGTSQKEERVLGRIVAGSGARLEHALEEYRAGLGRALARPAGRGPLVNVLLHAMGYFKDRLEPAEKAVFLDCLEGFRAGRLPLSACQAVLRAWNARHPDEWLSGQLFFRPFPPGLSDMGDSGRGRPVR